MVMGSVLLWVIYVVLSVSRELSVPNFRSQCLHAYMLAQPVSTSSTVAIVAGSHSSKLQDDRKLNALEKILTGRIIA
jgi:hypothetical protein